MDETALELARSALFKEDKEKVQILLDLELDGAIAASDPLNNPHGE